jgi:hypothetical protein
MGGYGTDELRTVFITGFPNDIKERELNNLLRFIPGYEASQMNWKNGQASGYVLVNCCCDLQEQQHASPHPSHPHTHAAATHTTAALHCPFRHKGSPCFAMVVLHVLHVIR